jgi:hypothetical protein
MEFEDKVMKHIAAVVGVLLTALLSYGMSPAQYRVVENLRHEEVVLPATAPDRARMVITDYAMVWDHQLPLLIMVSYDDLRTKTEVDYTEVYDLLGNLVVIAWTDRFGVYHVAVDEVLLSEEESDVPERRLVVVTGGTPA